MASMITAAREYLLLGIEPVPVEARSKAAVPDWGLVATTKDNVETRFAGDKNIGARLGPRSGGLCDIDLDCPEAVRLAPYFLDRKTRSFGRKSKERSHFIYWSDLHETENRGAIVFARGKGKNRRTLVELRVGGGGQDVQTVFPPSIHESGEEIHWWDDCPQIAKAPGAELLQQVTDIAVASLVLIHYPEPGLQARHDFCRDIDGFLTRIGWTFHRRVGFIEAVASAADDKEIRDRTLVCGRSEAKLEAGKAVAGLTRLRELLGKADADQILDWLRPEQYSQFPDVTKDGFPKATFPNTAVALGLLNIKCRYDRFALDVDLEGEVLEEEAGRLTDPALLRVRAAISKEFRFDPSSKMARDAVIRVAIDNKVHPVCEYLSALRWDGTMRIDQWLTSYAGAERSKYSQMVGRIFLIAMVRRVRQPGCKFDEMIVLEGEQGSERSTALSILAVREDWFTDSVRLNMKDKEIIECLRGKWVAEIAELGGMRKAEIEHVKALISRRFDRARLSFDITTTEAARQCVFAGSTNETKYLRDLTGNRRFWPVACTRFDLEALHRDRDQLLAEAALYEAGGASIRLPKELWEAAAVEQEKRTIDEPWFEILKLYLGELEGKVRSASIWEILDIKSGMLTQVHQERMGKVMRDLGWERRKAQRWEGDRVTCYVRGDGNARIQAARIEGIVVVTVDGHEADKPDY